MCLLVDLHNNACKKLQTYQTIMIESGPSAETKTNNIYFKTSPIIFHRWHDAEFWRSLLNDGLEIENKRKADRFKNNLTRKKTHIQTLTMLRASIV